MMLSLKGTHCIEDLMGQGITGAWRMMSAASLRWETWVKYSGYPWLNAQIEFSRIFCGHEESEYVQWRPVT
jgi:hypothetical protein